MTNTDDVARGESVDPFIILVQGIGRDHRPPVTRFDNVDNAEGDSTDD